MCGIAGILSFEHEPPPKEEIHTSLIRMLKAIAHRGPDGEGVWIDFPGAIALGHRRLAIVDLSSSSAQPMSNEDGSIWVTFNGEIYNHREIRKELESLGGHRWQTDHSDTEVILHAYEQWGHQCVHRFRGMFAFGLWDAKREQLWLVRDRIGIKPLYFSYNADRLVFSSEIKALLQDPACPRTINTQALFHYLSFLVAPAPMTMIQNISKLPAGHWLIADRNGRVKVQEYWDVWDEVRFDENLTIESAAPRILSELRESVQVHKESDVPIGVFLSGGIDSSLNGVLFAQDEGQPVNTFSIAYDANYSSQPSELPFARLIAKNIGAHHHERVLSQEDLWREMNRVAYFQDEPLGDPVCFPVLMVAELAREAGIKVCQVGEGADELFCGYPGWLRYLTLHQTLSIPMLRPFLGLAKSFFKFFPGNHSSRIEILERASTGRPIFWSGAETFSDTQKFQLLAPHLRTELASLDSYAVIEPLYKRFLSRCAHPTPLRWMTYVDLKLRLPELLLMRVDKMAMAVGIEGRVPFLDHKFVTTALAIPSPWHVSGRTTKALLKEAAKDTLPAAILTRQKQGFGVPIKEWMVKPSSEATWRAASESLAGEFFDRSVLQAMNIGNPVALWPVLNFMQWLSAPHVTA